MPIISVIANGWIRSIRRMDIDIRLIAGRNTPLRYHAGSGTVHAQMAVNLQSIVGTLKRSDSIFVPHPSRVGLGIYSFFDNILITDIAYN